jgi:acyl carrier protein
MSELRDKIIIVSQKVFGLEQIDENASQHDIEKWDSLGHLNLIVALEEEFNVSFEPEEIAEMQNIRTITRKLEQKLG